MGKQTIPKQREYLIQAQVVADALHRQIADDTTRNYGGETRTLASQGGEELKDGKPEKAREAIEYAMRAELEELRIVHSKLDAFREMLWNIRRLEDK